MDEEQVFQMHKTMYEIFMEQDYENEYFDVNFYVDGRKLYAHSATLAYESSVFKKQFIKNQSTRNEPIQIDDDFTFDEFFAFIRLFYLISNLYGYVEFDNTHIIALYKMSCIYGASDRIIKLLNRNGDLDDEKNEDIFELLVFAHKHSFTCYDFGVSIDYLIHDDDFVNLDKSVITALVYTFYCKTKKEDIYKAIYKWGEYQAMITVEMPDEEKKELVLHYIKDFLPLFNLDYKKMSIKFMFEFAVPKGFVSIDEANKYATIKVNITSNGKTISASFIDCYGIFELFQPFRHRQNYITKYCGEKKIYFDFCYGPKFKRPSTPSTIEKMKGCDWYLLFDAKDTQLYVKHRKFVGKNDYLIAEMKCENESGDFVFVDKKITAAASRIYTD